MAGHAIAHLVAVEPLWSRSTSICIAFLRFISFTKGGEVRIGAPKKIWVRWR